MSTNKGRFRDFARLSSKVDLPVPLSPAKIVTPGLIPASTSFFTRQEQDVDGREYASASDAVLGTSAPGHDGI